jgi:WD40 repeat protein
MTTSSAERSRPAATAARPRAAPYVGLNFYTEDDAEVFFGRETERRIIIANLRASRLTLLYAESGVGKSSLIRAGVASRLRELAERGRERRNGARHIPVVFSSWKDDPVRELISAIETAIQPFTDSDTPVELPHHSLQSAIDAAAAATTATLLILLDQFEEYFLYKPREATPGRLAESLAICLHRRDLRANFLIAVREDAYAGVGDLFKGRVENIYGNFLHLAYLDRECAREAIEQPLARFRELHPDGGPSAIEPELVEEVLNQVRTGQVVLEQSGQGTLADGAGNGHGPAAEEIETPYLQLVMRTLWERERSAGSDRLRLSTLQDLGGAQEIVRSHLDSALADLSDDERDIAVDVFHHLVTPSGTKIAFTIPDLAAYSGRSIEQVSSLVQRLTGGGQRILRPVPAGEDGQPRVEIFHDVLAPAILAWRTRQAAVRLDHERQTAVESASRARRQAQLFRALAGGAIALLLVAIFAFVYAEVQKSKANSAQRQSDSAVLAGQGFVDLTAGALAPGVLRSIEAYRADPSPEARTDLVSSLVLTEGMADYLRAQSGPVNKVAFSPGGQLLASASADQTIVLLNLRTGRRRTLLAGSAPTESVAFSDDRRYLASVGDDGNVAVWNVASGRLLRRFSSHAGPLYDVAFAPTSRILATSGASGAVTIWNLATGRVLETLSGHAGAINSVAFSPKGIALASANSNGSVIVWDLATGRRQTIAVRNGAAVNGVAFSPDGATIAAASQDGSAYLIDAVSGRRLHVLTQSADTAVQTVAFSPDGATVASGGTGQRVWLWNVSDGRLLRAFQGQTNTVESVAFSPNGRLIASGSDDRSVFVWDTSLGYEGHSFKSGHGDALGVALDPPQDLVASANQDGTVSVWSLRTGRERVLAGDDGTLESVAFSRDGTTLVASGQNGKVVVWSVPGFERRRPLAGPVSGILWSVALAPDGHTVAAGSDSGDILVWDLEDGKLIRDLHGRSGGVYGVAFSPDGATLAAGDADGTVIVWDAAGGRRLETLTGHTAAVNGVAFSPDGTEIAAGSDDDTIILWNARTGAQIGGSLQGHQDHVDAVAFSPDGRTLASSSSDHTVIVWNLANRLGEVLGGHADVVSSLAYGAATLASADFTGRVVVYTSLPAISGVGPIDERLCSVVRQNLTRQEWTQLLPHEPYHRTCPTYP